MSTSPNTPLDLVASHKPNYLYIDCVRGYAILMVITIHLAYAFPQLPYPFARIVVHGWYGVQLFFLASCVTLLMSWQYERARSDVDVRAFLIRRFFRVAPGYYCAGLLYFVIDPPKSGFNTVQLLAAYTFTNVWHPLLTPTVAGRWLVVPGGWSIGVEFTFYFLFPLIAATITSMRRACILFVSSLVAAAVINTLAYKALAPAFGMLAVDNFLYFWFPNQAIVFALGTVLFHLIGLVGDPRMARLRDAIVAGRHVIIIGVWIAFICIAQLPLAHFITTEKPYVPTVLPIVILLSVFVLVLSQIAPGLWINRPVAAMGKVSFSAYLVHFAVIFEFIKHFLPAIFETTRFTAIFAYFALWPTVVLLSFFVASCSYNLIELPFMRLGKRCARLLTARP